MHGAQKRNVRMNERHGIVTMKGDSVTLVGAELAVGDKAPEAELLANDLSPVKLSSFSGNVTALVSVPSLDTDVCDKEARRFNEEAAALGRNVAVNIISMDLPFAQKRWCAANDIQNVQTLSDHRFESFGTAYGVLIKELRLLARAVFVVDKEGTIGHIQLVDEITDEPDYDAALETIRQLA
jgi:thiol peroxidase